MKFGLLIFKLNKTHLEKEVSVEKGDRVLVYESHLQNITQPYKFSSSGNGF